MSGSSLRTSAIFFALFIVFSPDPGRAADGGASTAEPALDPAVQRAFWSMMQNVRYGFSESEEAAFVVRAPDGTFSLVRWTPSGLPHRGMWSGRFPDGTVAIAHTHPNWVPMPSRIDARTARRTGLPVYVVTRFTIARTAGGAAEVVVGGEWHSRLSMKTCTSHARAAQASLRCSPHGHRLMRMNEAWLQHYDAGVPAHIDHYPQKTLVDFVREHARDRGSSPALKFKGRAITFAELDSLSDALATAFRREGVVAGDRVGLVLPNCPQFLIAEIAAWKLGAIVAPQSPIYTARELEESLGTSAPRLVVTLTPFYDKVKEAFRGRVVATNIKEYLPALLRGLFTMFKEKSEGHRITLREGDAWLQDLLASGEGAEPIEARCVPASPAVILMSGGTTGTPKGVLSDHRSLVMSGTQLSAWLREAIEVEGASVMLPLPLFHTYGCAGAQPLTLMRGIPLILVPNPRDIDDVVKTIQHSRPTLLCGVPTLFSALLAHREVVAGKVDFRSIRACFSGAAALMAETKKNFEELTGGRIVEGYSLTEATMACCVNPLRGPNKIGSVGMPISDVTVKIVESETGDHEMGPGEMGEIAIRAPQLMRAYWNNETETSATVRDGWLFTGDLGYLDEDGYVFIVDRKKDVIKTSGFQVWPREVEEIIATHPAVAEVGVAGIPDAKRGEAVAAWIVPRAGQSVDASDVRLWCHDKLAPYKVPTHIEFRADLPKTMIGKVLRRKLTEEARAATP